MRFTSIVALSLFASSNAWAVCPAGTTSVSSPCGSDRFAGQSFDDVCQLSGTISDDLQLSAENLYVLSGPVLVGADKGRVVGANEDPVQLTVDAGTTIVGASDGDYLVVTRGNQIFANGTSTNPVVFTACQEVPAGFGGLIINGRAPVNFSDLQDLECVNNGTCEFQGEGMSGLYGGSVEDDNSGVLEYVRVEFGGDQVNGDLPGQIDELNGIAFQGVGSGTTVSFIQAYQCADDGVEFFGGTVNVDHVVVFAASDDGFDWTSGWRGTAENVLVDMNDTGDNGIEADNVAKNGLQNLEPRSLPTIRNLTVVNAPDHAALFREGTGGFVSDAIFTGTRADDACLDIDGAASIQLARRRRGAKLTFTNIAVGASAGCPGGSFKDESDASAAILESIFIKGSSSIEDLVLGNGYISPAGETRGAVLNGDDWTAGWARLN